MFMRIPGIAAWVAALAILFSSIIETNAAGALATGKCGAFGYSFDDLSPEAAALRARAQCKGQTCKVVTSFRRACADARPGAEHRIRGLPSLWRPQLHGARLGL